MNKILQSLKTLILNIFQTKEKPSVRKVETYLMTDLETTGIDPTITEIMEIASVEVEFDGFSLTPKSHFHKYIKINTPPNMNDEFVVKYQLGLYEKCLNLPNENSKEQAIKEWEEYKSKVYGKSQPKFSGLNFGAFDEQYLLVHGFLKKGYKDDKGKMYSSYTYRHLELQTFIQVGAMQLGMKTTEFCDKMVALDDSVQLPEGSAHTALYDTYRQIKLFNGCMKFINFRK
jgi:hypothetical protein